MGIGAMVGAAVPIFGPTRFGLVAVAALIMLFIDLVTHGATMVKYRLYSRRNADRIWR